MLLDSEKKGRTSHQWVRTWLWLFGRPSVFKKSRVLWGIDGQQARSWTEIACVEYFDYLSWSLYLASSDLDTLKGGLHDIVDL